MAHTCEKKRKFKSIEVSAVKKPPPSMTKSKASSVKQQP